MRNKKLLALLLVLTLVITVLGCGSKKVDKKDSTVESTEERETLDDDSSTKEEESDKTDASATIEDESNNIEDNSSSMDKNESEHSNENSTSGSGTDNSGSANNSGSSNNNSGSSNTGSTNTQTKPIYEHTWTEVVEDEIHYYAWRTICNVCKKDITDMNSEELAIHVVIECGGSYANYYKEVDFITENVVKTPVVTGYKCSCGETKEK